MLSVGIANAQTDPTNSTATSDASLSKDGGDGVSVRLVDNKGTIKYLQTNNGITSITSTTAASTTTTTWQLGGSLTAETYIDVDGKAFALDGIKLIAPNAADLIITDVDPRTGITFVDAAAVTSYNAAKVASSNATNQSDHGTGIGWTVLIRDEATGKPTRY